MQSNTKTIILHGYLRDLYPHDIVVEAQTVAEAIRVLVDIPELKPTVGQGHSVQIKDVDTKLALYSLTDMQEIHIHPLEGGAGGKNGLLQILIGVAFVALAFLNPLGILGMSQTMLFLSGGLMAAGGLLQMLMPTPKTEESKSSRSFSGGGSQNSVQMGTPISLAYGFVKLGGQYLSFDVDAKEFSGENTPTGTATVTNQTVFVKHDATAVQVGVVMPTFAGAVAAATGNVPTSGWIR